MPSSQNTQDPTELMYDHLPGSTMLPAQVSTPNIKTKELEFINDEGKAIGISQDYTENHYQRIPSSYALYEAFSKLQFDIDKIDPNHRFYQDQAVVSKDLIDEHFATEDTKVPWKIQGWTIANGVAIYEQGTEDSDNNFLKVPQEAFYDPTYYHFHVNVSRLDSGRLVIYDSGDQIVTTITDVGDTHLEMYIASPASTTIRIVAEGVYTGDIIKVEYAKLHAVKTRFRDYLLGVLDNVGLNINGIQAADVRRIFKEEIAAPKAELQSNIENVNQTLIVHISETGNVHQTTPESIGAAPKDHSHPELDAYSNIVANEVEWNQHVRNVAGNPHRITCEMIGAAVATHDHPEYNELHRQVTDHLNGTVPNPHNVTCSMIGAAAEDHIHPEYEVGRYAELDPVVSENINSRINTVTERVTTHINDTNNPHQLTPESIGAASDAHTHSLDSLGAAAKEHVHTLASLGAATANHTHSLESLHAAADDHIHLLDDLNAAAKDHSHTPESIGAASQAHTHSLEELHAADVDHAHSLEDLGAAAIDHTHIPADIGAAAINHTHTAESLGVATADHTHNPEMIGAAVANHTHLPEELGAAPIEHTHTAEEVGALAIGTTPETIGAAAIGHTHSAEELGVASVHHTHVPSECGAAAIIHTHTPEECGAAAVTHTHTAQDLELNLSDLNISAETIGAASINHTHNLEDLGAASVDHTHELEDLGAAPIEHTHTPEEVGAAALNHTHDPSDIGAATSDHTHSLEDLHAASEDHNHDDQYLQLSYTAIVDESLQTLQDAITAQDTRESIETLQASITALESKHDQDLNDLSSSILEHVDDIINLEKEERVSEDQVTRSSIESIEMPYTKLGVINPSYRALVRNNNDRRNFLTPPTAIISDLAIVHTSSTDFDYYSGVASHTQGSGSVGFLLGTKPMNVFSAYWEDPAIIAGVITEQAPTFTYTFLMPRVIEGFEIYRDFKGRVEGHVVSIQILDQNDQVLAQETYAEEDWSAGAAWIIHCDTHEFTTCKIQVVEASDLVFGLYVKPIFKQDFVEDSKYYLSVSSLSVRVPIEDGKTEVVKISDNSCILERKPYKDAPVYLYLKKTDEGYSIDQSYIPPDYTSLQQGTTVLENVSFEYNEEEEAYTHPVFGSISVSQDPENTALVVYDHSLDTFFEVEKPADDLSVNFVHTFSSIEQFDLKGIDVITPSGYTSTNTLKVTSSEAISEEIQTQSNPIAIVELTHEEVYSHDDQEANIFTYRHDDSGIQKVEVALCKEEGEGRATLTCLDLYFQHYGFNPYTGESSTFIGIPLGRLELITSQVSTSSYIRHVGYPVAKCMTIPVEHYNRISQGKYSVPNPFSTVDVRVNLFLNGDSVVLETNNQDTGQVLVTATDIYITVTALGRYVIRIERLW